MIAVFFGAWAGAYLAAGSPRISYAGFQIAFAFFLCIIQGSGPEFDLTVARDRIIGVLLGNVVAYFTLVHVWPVSVSRRVDPALAMAFRKLAKVAAADAPRERQLLASEVQATLRNTETDIELVSYEPVSIRSPAAWIVARRQAIENAQSLTSLLLLSGNSNELTRVSAGRHLLRLATCLDGTSDPEAVRSSNVQSVHGGRTVPVRASQYLRALERLLAPGAADTEASPHARS